MALIKQLHDLDFFMTTFLCYFSYLVNKISYQCQTFVITYNKLQLDPIYLIVCSIYILCIYVNVYIYISLFIYSYFCIKSAKML